MRWACCVSIDLATKRALTPKANPQADTGCSIEPCGVEGERVPRREVGEYWPLVSP